MSEGRATNEIPGVAPARLVWRVDLDVLVVEFRGRRDTPAHMAGCWRAIADVAERVGLDKVLAIDLMDDEPFVGEQREAFIRLLSVEIFGRRRWAYVARSIDRVRAYEATQLDAQQAGADVRVFSSLAQAELWVRLPG